MNFFSSMLRKFRDFSFGTMKFVGCHGDSLWPGDYHVKEKLKKKLPLVKLWLIALSFQRFQRIYR